MCNESTDLLGMSCNKVEADQRTDAAAEHERRFVRERCKKTVRVVAVCLECQTFAWRVDLTPGQPSSVVGHNRVVIDEVVAKAVGSIGVAMSTGQNQEQRT